MPTLLNENGFKFFFYANEHEPKHIHVARSDGFAKVELHEAKRSKSGVTDYKKQPERV